MYKVGEKQPKHNYTWYL